MEDISNRITKLTQELRALHAQLDWRTFQSYGPETQDRVLSDLLNTGIGHDLKQAIDLFSQFLWCYIESAAARTSADEVDYAQQSIRLAQITELLRLLHHSACPLVDSLAFVEHTAVTVHRRSEARQPRRVLKKGIA
ncbi:MAG TPA: hypothetical protein VFB79_16460 [Candidatus Angelobacter sp.]|nr:hypothetical protein [Candidatus Angelobacter sp.]